MTTFAAPSSTSLIQALSNRRSSFQSVQGNLAVPSVMTPRVESLSVRKSKKIIERNHASNKETSFDFSSVEVSLPPVQPRLKIGTGAEVDAAIPQIWEGTVVSVNSDEGWLQASFTAKNSQIEDHIGKVYFEWVMEQDKELIVPGAVFYLTIYRSRRRGGTIVNSQELRFRRLPAWNSGQINKIEELASQLSLKIKARPDLND